MVSDFQGNGFTTLKKDLNVEPKLRKKKLFNWLRRLKNKKKNTICAFKMPFTFKISKFHLEIETKKQFTYRIDFHTKIVQKVEK